MKDVKNDRVYLGHIREAIEDIQRYAEVGRDAFLTDGNGDVGTARGMGR